MKKIVFVCTGNTCRSPMAEYLSKNIFKENNIDIIVTSRGTATYPNMNASHNATVALYAIGIDAKNHMSQNVSLHDLQINDIILTMTKNQKQLLISKSPEYEHKIFMLSEMAENVQNDIIDPYGGDLPIYERCMAQIKHYIEQIVLQHKNNQFY